MHRSDNELLAKYADIRKTLKEQQEQQLPADAQKLLSTSKALGHLEGAISLVLIRLKGAQIELNSPEVNQAIIQLQDALVKAKELAPGFSADNK